jgi:hypothetical protein
MIQTVLVRLDCASTTVCSVYVRIPEEMWPKEKNICVLVEFQVSSIL